MTILNKFFGKFTCCRSSRLPLNRSWIRITLTSWRSTLTTVLYGRIVIIIFTYKLMLTHVIPKDFVPAHVLGIFRLRPTTQKWPLVVNTPRPPTPPRFPDRFPGAINHHRRHLLRRSPKSADPMQKSTWIHTDPSRWGRLRGRVDLSFAASYHHGGVQQLLRP